MTTNRRSVLVFAGGLTVGFLLTYILLSVTSPRIDGPQSQQILLPNAPHSAGENDHFSGPDKEQRWEDFHAENHHDEDAVAQELFARVRVLCWVMTSPGNLQSKARHIKATWGRRCNKLLFMSSEKDASLPAVGLPVSEGRNHLWGKTKEAFKYVYAHHMGDADWFLKADDDTYVILENLRLLLQEHDSRSPLYLGRRFKPYISQGYMSGGAGYILSKEAVRRFVEKGIAEPPRCRRDDGGPEDLEIGQCLQQVGVRIVDSRDALGRETFHPFVPEHHLIPGLVPKDNWYWEYNYYPAKEGPACCSDFAITFHYVPPNMMYVFEYFIYHLRPFGIESRIVMPSEKYQPVMNMASRVSYSVDGKLAAAPPPPNQQRSPRAGGERLAGHGSTTGQHQTAPSSLGKDLTGPPTANTEVPRQRIKTVAAVAPLYSISRDSKTISRLLPRYT